MTWLLNSLPTRRVIEFLRAWAVLRGAILAFESCVLSGLEPTSKCS